VSIATCEPCWWKGPLPDLTDYGDTVVANGLSLSTGGAFMALSSYLLTDPAPKRRTNSLIPNADGLLGRPGFRTERTIDFDVRVSGEVDENGVVWADPVIGVEHNIDLLAAYTIDAEEDQFGCITWRVVRKSGKILEGPVQVNDFYAEKGVGDRIVWMNLTLPDGYLPELVED